MNSDPYKINPLSLPLVPEPSSTCQDAAGVGDWLLVMKAGRDAAATPHKGRVTKLRTEPETDLDLLPGCPLLTMVPT